MKWNIRLGRVGSINYVVALLVTIVFLNACKPKEIVTTDDNNQKTEEVNKLNELKKTLNTVLVNADDLTVDELQQKIAALKAMNYEDTDVLELIQKMEAKLDDKKKQIAIMEEQKKKAADHEASFEVRFPKNLNDLAVTTTLIESDKLIAETLTYFSSPDALVLIIVSKEDGYVDYDEPTTIKKYLEYVKDQKESKNKVDKVVLDDNGKIKELELIKK